MSKIIGRLGDMDRHKALVLLQQDDGDLIAAIGYAPRGMAGTLADCPGGGAFDDLATVEFCSTTGGGGRSPNVRKALAALWAAIEEDNAADPARAIDNR